MWDKLALSNFVVKGMELFIVIASFPPKFWAFLQQLIMVTTAYFFLVLTLKSVALFASFDFSRHFLIFNYFCNGWGPSLFQNQLILHGKFCVSQQELALGHLTVCTRMVWSQLWCLVCHQSQFFCACLCRLALAAHTSGLWEVSVFLPLIFLAWSAFPLRFLCCQLPLPEWAKTSPKFQVLR